MKIDINLIENLAENIDKYGLSEITLENEDAKIILKKEKPQIISSQITKVIPAQEIVVDSIEEEEVIIEEDTEAYEAILSPMVGTFYAAPGPDAQNFVKEGQAVKQGDTLCIIEAMKLMNEVKSTANGTIVKILVQDGQSVKKVKNYF